MRKRRKIAGKIPQHLKRIGLMNENRADGALIIIIVL